MIEYYNKISEDWGKTEIGEQGDATTLENFLKALDYLEECNKLRVAEGLPELKVTTMAMAYSQANCNHAAVGGDHWRTPYVSEDGKRRYSGGENLSWGYGTTTPNEEGYEFRQDPRAIRKRQLRYMKPAIFQKILTGFRQDTISML